MSLSRRLVVFVVLVSIILLPAAAQAEAGNFVAVADATLIEDFSGSRANGSADAIYVGRTQRDGNRRGLLRFDLSSLPPGAIVQSATLHLHLLRGRPDNEPLSLHRTLASWGEGASNAFGGGGTAAAPGDATWLHRFFGATQLWSNPGGDFVAAASAEELIEAPEGVTHHISAPGMAADVQAWIDQPTGNHGWLLIGGVNSAKAYASREHATAGLRPQLTVTWSLPEPVAAGDAPLPFWALTLLAGALFAAARRQS